MHSFKAVQGGLWKSLQWNMIFRSCLSPTSKTTTARKAKTTTARKATTSSCTVRKQLCECQGEAHPFHVPIRQPTVGSRWSAEVRILSFRMETDTSTCLGKCSWWWIFMRKFSVSLNHDVEKSLNHCGLVTTVSSNYNVFASPPPWIASRWLAVGAWQMIGGDCASDAILRHRSVLLKPLCGTHCC